jgi:hypothetical protein
MTAAGWHVLVPMRVTVGRELELLADRDRLAYRPDAWRRPRRIGLEKVAMNSAGAAERLGEPASRLKAFADPGSRRYPSLPRDSRTSLDICRGSRSPCLASARICFATTSHRGSEGSVSFRIRHARSWAAVMIAIVCGSNAAACGGSPELMSCPALHSFGAASAHRPRS